MSKFKDCTFDALYNDDSTKISKDVIFVDDPNFEKYEIKPEKEIKKMRKRRASVATEISTNPIVNIKTPTN